MKKSFLNTSAAYNKARAGMPYKKAGGPELDSEDVRRLGLINALTDNAMLDTAYRQWMLGHKDEQGFTRVPEGDFIDDFLPEWKAKQKAKENAELNWRESEGSARINPEYPQPYMNKKQRRDTFGLITDKERKDASITDVIIKSLKEDPKIIATYAQSQEAGHAMFRSKLAETVALMRKAQELAKPKRGKKKTSLSKAVDVVQKDVPFKGKAILIKKKDVDTTPKGETNTVKELIRKDAGKRP